MKKKIILPVVTILLMIIGVIGVTYAFFNYTREGPANTIAVGRIYFKHEQGNTITLENVFPISSEHAQTDTVNAKTLAISVIGDTDYDGGIEYVVTLDSVNNSKSVPINLEVSVIGNGLGTEEIGDYYTNRESYTESKYKIEYDDKLFNSNHILVGYISPNTIKGNIEGINGSINIKAYIDSSRVLISDTYPEGKTIIDGVEYYNGKPFMNQKVLTTEEWNSIKGTNALSFKIKVEAREGIWVEEPATPTSCFTTTAPIPTYTRNPNMDINACVSKFTELGANNGLQEGETLEAYCNGTGTGGGVTLQESLVNDLFPPSMLTELENVGIIINIGYTTIITDYDASCGSDVVIPSKIETELVTYTRNSNMDINTCVSKFTEMGFNEYLQEGETLEAFCDGTGTNYGETLQEILDMGDEGFSSSELIELETAGIIVPNTTPVQANITVIADNSFANKNLTSVTIPNSVTTVLNNAFSNNNHLTSLDIDMIDIPESFSSNQGIRTLTNLTIGNSVQTVGSNAFANYDWTNQLTNLTIHNGVTSIGNQAFNLNLISTLNIDMTNIPQNFISQQVIPSTPSGKVISTLNNLIIGNHVQTIGNNAFNDSFITDVTVPNNVIERPWDDNNYCYYFKRDVNVSWNNQSVTCYEDDQAI